LNKRSENRLFLMDQFKAVHDDSILPTDEDFASVEEP
jgi:hypothetical protein